MDSLIAKALEEVVVAACRGAGGRAESRRRDADRHRRAALLPAEVHAQFGDRIRSAGSAQFRRRDRPLRAICRGARAQHSAQTGGARRDRARISRAELNADAMARQLGAEDSWQVLLAASKADSAVGASGDAGEPAHVARYAFQLAQAFNNFYQQVPRLAGTGSREESLPAVDDGFLPPTVGEDGRDIGDQDPGLYVESLISCRRWPARSHR